jgi:hypothetical protein
VHADEGWHSVVVDGEWVIGVQAAQDHVPPDWPAGPQQQQVHLDLHVDHLQEAHQVRAGARRSAAASAAPAGGQPDGDESFAVYASPAGHPLCFGVH